VTISEGIGLFVALCLFVYFLVALLMPERF
jgi:K+-transporting ATPase KdpF subunit